MKKIINYIPLLIIVLSFSCNTSKYIYFREPKIPPGDSVFYATQKPDYQIQPGDIIYLRFKSSLSDMDSYFNFSTLPANNSMMASSTGQSSGMYLNEFVVDDHGNIRIPVIGILHVAGNDINEIQQMVQDNARKYVADVLVKAKLVSYTVSFIGEFGNPGKVTFYKDHVSILDAIAQVGEVTYYGNRRHIRVMRQTPKGIYTYHIDLTDPSLLTSKKFYLEPNDVVYAEPLPRKIFRTEVSDYTFILATITSSLAFVTLILSLKKL